MSPPLLFLLAGVVTSSAACGPKMVMVNGVEMSYEDGARRVYDEGKKAQAGGDVATAKVRYKEVVDLFPEAPVVPDALGELSSILLEESGCKAARLYLEQLAEQYPVHGRAAAAKDALARCDAGRSAAEPSVTAGLSAQFDRAASDAERRKLALEAAEAASAAGDHGASVRWLLKRHALAEAPPDKKGLEARITELIDSKVSAAEVRQLLEEVEGNDFPKALLTYKLARIQYHTRDLENAGETLRRYLATWPAAAEAAGAKALLAMIGARAVVKPRVIGVVLPLSGSHRGYGENALEAIQLAIEGEEKKPGALQLVVKDSKNDKAQAAQAVQELVLEHGVVAVLGPMFSGESLAAGYKAQELGVPLLTVSSAEELGQLGPYVFRNGLTGAAQARALVAYAMDVAGLKSFAVLYPRHPYGEELLHAFWDEVEKRKGEIRGVESYGTEDTTFSAQVKSLVARDVVNLRADYRKAIDECDKQPDSYRKARCKDRVGESLKPIVDFDGLFIPDYPKSIAMVSAALAFEDIIVETEPRILKKIEKTLGHKVKPVTLLGASGWNSPELPEKAERNVENALFTDAFFLGADDKETADFLAAFQRRFKRTPTVVDALAYDSARILRQVIEGQSPQGRDMMREALRQVAAFPGVTGKTSFAKGPDAEKQIRILTIKNGKIEEAAANPPKPSSGED